MPRLAPLSTSALVLLAALLLGLNLVWAETIALNVLETRLVVTQAGGKTLTSEALIGVPLTIDDPQSGLYTARIHAIATDPFRPDLTLYDVAFQHPKTGQWEPLCYPGRAGLAMAVPIPGYWRRDGTYQALPPGQITFTCTAGAHVKCLRMGYYPWASTADGRSMRPYHQACMRMMRADYCGKGTPFTVTGRRIQVVDTTGHRQPRKRYGSLEAVWGVDGAVCVRRVRVPSEFPLEQVLSTCPSLRPQVRESCDEAELYRNPAALLANWSQPQ